MQPKNALQISVFVLLLSLTPFLFDLSLFTIGKPALVPSEYLIDPLRYEGQSYDDLSGSSVSNSKLPAKPKVRLNKRDRDFFVKLVKMAPETYCKSGPKLPPLKAMALSPLLKKMQPLCTRYNREWREYKRKKSRIDRANRKDELARKALAKQADDYLAATQMKPDAPTPTVVQYSENHFNAIANQLRATSTDNPSLNSTFSHILLLPAWIIGLILTLPALVFAWKMKAWALLSLGLLIPAYNALIDVLALTNLVGMASLFQLTSPVFAQVAFVFFLVTCRLRSKCFAYFVIFVAISAILPALLTWFSEPTIIESSSTEYSISRSFLALGIFVFVSCLARLVILGAREKRKTAGDIGAEKHLLYRIEIKCPMAPDGVTMRSIFYLVSLDFAQANCRPSLSSTNLKAELCASDLFFRQYAPVNRLLDR